MVANVWNYQTFATVERRLLEKGIFALVIADYGRECIIRTPGVGEEILERVAEDQKLSTKRFGFQVIVSKDVVNIL